ncbi:MAG TPA: DUF3306 domain-containing protein [Burkholderiales bacterium]|nr:DUF3306 domain-containing protein [Burkholderiales bacterium]
MSDDTKDPFLSRWSRRKVAARRGEALPEPAAPAPTPVPAPVQAPAVALAEPATDLPSIDTLKGLESEYKAFMQPDVDPATRTAALKKLFGDPHFNTMDRLDVYIDDYSIPDPIPAAMLKTLSAARTLGLFDDDDAEKKKAQSASGADAESAPEALAAPEGAPSASTPQPEPEPPEPVDGPGKPDAA